MVSVTLSNQSFASSSASKPASLYLSVNQVVEGLVNIPCKDAANNSTACSGEESKILSRAVSSGLRTYDLEMTASTIRLSAGILPISASEIEALELAARHAALIDFDRSIISPRGYETEDSDASTRSRWLRRSDTAWMLNTSAAAMHRDHAEKGMLGKGEDWKRRNEAAAAGKCEIVRKGIVVDF